MDKGVCQVMAKVHMNLWVRSNKEKLKAYIYNIFTSQGLPFGSPFSPTLADLEYILRIHALIFHWLRLPVHVSNQKTFYTEHMLSTKCKQRWHRNALIWQRFATSRFGSNKNIFPVCQSFETFTWLTISVSKLNLSQTSFLHWALPFSTLQHTYDKTILIGWRWRLSKGCNFDKPPGGTACEFQNVF